MHWACQRVSGKRLECRGLGAVKVNEDLRNNALPNYIFGGKSVVLKKEGYYDQSLMINSKFQPCGLWNLLCWPGFLIDAAAGNTVKIDPMNLNLVGELEPVKSVNATPAKE